MQNLYSMTQFVRSANLLSRKLICIQLYFLSLFILVGTGWAQITITGVADMQIYADSVSFTVVSESGFDYTAELNGTPIEIDVLIEVDEAEYYELNVSKIEQGTGTEESLLVRFIVRASERLNTEWGLPLFTPYPMVDSAAAEYAGASLEIVTPAEYPQGLEIPVIVRVEDISGKRLGVNGSVTAAGFQEHPLQLLRGVGSVFLPPATQAGNISYTAQIHSLQTPKQIAIEAATTWQTVSGTIASTTDWGQNGRIKVTNDLTIPAGVTLTIGPGSVIVVSPNVEITIDGHIIVNGTNALPVVFTAQDRTAQWGGFIMESATSQGDFTGSIFTASGADPDWFSGKDYFTHHDEQCLFLLSDDAHVTLTDCYMVENAGQIGHGEHGYLTMIGCLMQKAVTVGQYNNGSIVFEDSAMIEFPLEGASFVDDDNDCIYLSGGPHSFTDCLFGWTLDDGIDGGQGDTGSVNVDGCWFESTIHEAMAWSSGNPRNATVTDTVAINCGQAIECGYDQPLIDADNCLCTGNLVGARFGDNYDRSYTGFLDVQNSLLLFNHRDVWGRAWDNWQLHLAQMDIQNNYLSVPNDNYPNNTIWDPQNEPNQLNELEFFLPTPAGTVGIGIAVPQDVQDLSELELENKIPVRLSTFTTSFVSVNYTVNTNLGAIGSGVLNFTPGQTVRHIEFTLPSSEEIRQVRIALSDPVNAELTKYSVVIYEKPYEIVDSLVAEGDIWDYFKGTSEPPADWNQLAFTPVPAWLTGPSGFGYEASSGYEACIATNLTDMRNNYISIYARKLFWVDDPTRMTELILTMEWDDGYIAYLNGIPIDSQNPPNPVAYNQPASSDTHEACCGSGCTPRQVDLASFIAVLDPGFNVLAIQVHNGTLGSSDFIFIPMLSSVTTPYPGDFEPDGDVDLEDFAVLAKAWLAQDGQSHYDPICDIDGSSDGSINILDLAVFVQNWLAGS
ncbi:MAG: hypothetical protein JW912_04550 [Sedimentisphaerales bacterium]|nr:hypothetical protein [Sedimentisphaerales bacterium]